MRISLIVNKANVYDEVAKTTSYAGSKLMYEDTSAYNRIFTTDEDRLLLERFWVETCNITTEQFKPFIVSVSSQPISHGVDLSQNYIVELEVSSAFDTALTQSVETSLYSFFVFAITSKWYAFTNKTDVENIGSEATNTMESIMRKIYFRKKPARITPNI